MAIRTFNSDEIRDDTADEVDDIRVDTDGRIYTSAGDAVRRQTSRLQTTTRNLANIKVISERTANGLTYSVDSDGHVRINGTATKQTDVPIFNVDIFELTRSRYMASFYGDYSVSQAVRCYLYNGVAYPEYIASITNTFKFQEIEDTYAGIMLRFASGCVVDIDAYVQFEQGITDTGYIPHYVAKDQEAREEIVKLKNNQNTLSKTWLKMLNTSYIGDCVILKLPNDKIIMVDTGYVNDRMTPALTNAIATMSITHIDHLIISHFHIDHVQNIGVLNSSGLIDSGTNVYLPSGFDGNKVTNLEGNTTTADAYTTTMAVLNNAGCNLIYPTDGYKFTEGVAVVDFFNCDHSDYWDNLISYNDCSICNYITIGDIVLLFTGDMDITSIRKWNKFMRKCNIMKMPHHCGLGEYDNLFMNSAFPEVCLSSLGINYTFNSSESNRRVFIDNQNGFQTWLEMHEIPNYIVGIMDSDIDMEISTSGFKFLTNVRRCIRADENLV